MVLYNEVSKTRSLSSYKFVSLLPIWSGTSNVSFSNTENLLLINLGEEWSLFKIIFTRKELLLNSKIGNILKDNPHLCDYKIEEGECIKYKGRLYGWCNISKAGKLRLNQNMMKTLDIDIGDKLLSIRSSDIAFCMGQKGELIERAKNYQGEIVVY